MISYLIYIMELFAHDIYLYVIALGGQTTGPNWLNFYNGIPGATEAKKCGNYNKKVNNNDNKNLDNAGCPSWLLIS